MRELTLDEMTVVTGAAGSSNSPVSSGEFRGSFLGAAVSVGMNSALDQIDLYVEAYERGGLTAVAAVSPAAKAIIAATAFLVSINPPSTEDTTTEDGNDYCDDGCDY